MAVRVIVYEATSEEAGPHNRFMGRIYLGGTQGFHPLVTVGSSAERVREHTEAWWTREVEKEAAKHAPRGRKAEAAPISVEPDFDVI